MESVLTVSQLVEAINLTLAELENVVVEGEVDEFKIIHQKWVTFQLKDKDSAIGCFLTVWQYKTQIEDGMLVRVQGRPTLRNKGFFSFVVSRLAPSGEGALKRAFELLKAKLTQEGLFAPERKRSLPRFPEHIALITSRDAAAYSDFVKVLQGRLGGLTVSFLHTQVQGADAPAQLIAALEYANTHVENIDAIVLVRGGGSLEDLQAFNDETLVRAVAASRTPTIIGVGHERDITLAELAADVRASTPSNAAELLVRSRQELLLEVQHMRTRLQTAIAVALQQRSATVVRVVTFLRSRVNLTQRQVNQQLESLAALRQRLRQTVVTKREAVARAHLSLRRHFHEHVRQQQYRITQIQRVVTSFSPQHTLRRGYSITRREGGRLVRSAQEIEPGQTISTQLSDGTVNSRVEKVAGKLLA